MDGAVSAGVSTVHVIAKHDEDDVLPSGTAFDASAIAPVWSGAAAWDPLAAATCALCRARRPSGTPILPRGADGVVVRPFGRATRRPRSRG